MTNSSEKTLPSRDTVMRIHRVHELHGSEENVVIEAIADLLAYCGEKWPAMFKEAARRCAAEVGKPS